MKIAEYPQRKCRMNVSGQFQDSSCSLPEMHDNGPCATYDVPESVKNRDSWEAQHPDLAYKGIPGLSATYEVDPKS